MTEVVAYEWAGLTFCPSCALSASNMGMLLVMLAKGRKPERYEHMDDLIASMALMQVESGLEILTPVPTTTTEEEACGQCRRPFPATQKEAS